jgi:type VI secretion system protein ImpM
VTEGSASDGSTSRIAGWYGKLPALGDFASRRLPASFVTFWDEWLQHSLSVSRAQLGEHWLPTYLKSPIWRFALLPLVWGPTAWTGILMPSVDRVGRYFPLTIAINLEPPERAMTIVAAADDWYERIEHLALETLNASFGATDLDRGLSELPFPLPAPAPSEEDAQSLVARDLAHWWHGGFESPLIAELDSTRDFGSMISLAAEQLMGAHGERRSLWWTRDGRAGTTALRCYLGLPPFGDFVHMMNAGR